MKKSIKSYIDLYAGIEYEIHYKYSYILNLTYISFMFGAGMPLLFIIALLSMCVLYITERLLVAYAYRQPPMFDHNINRSAIKIILFAPYFYLTFGYWMLSNNEIFKSDV
jgi:hypothetical protein